MSKIARFTLFIITFLILSALFWSFTPGVEAATVTASQTNLANPAKKPASFIGQAQAGCSSTITVANNGDSGVGSLRKALTDVCSGGTINFVAGLANQTISLTSAELSITKTVTIINPNAANLKVSGNNAHRVFNIQAGAVVTISSLSIISGTITEGCDFGLFNCGGGIRVEESDSEAILMVNHSILNSNSANFDGGIYNYGGTVTVNPSIISGNSAYYGGGGIYAAGGRTVVNNSLFSSNSASSGGGIHNGGYSTINNSTFNNNSAIYGGGIYNGYGHTLTLNNSTISGNSVIGYGGGIYSNEGNPIHVNNSTITGNSAINGGGGLYHIGRYAMHLRNTIIANSPYGGDCDNASFSTNFNNLIEDGSCNPAFSGDPNLGPLADNGGPTPIHALIYPSPAIDMGDAATCTADPINNLDQRGIARPLDGNNDGNALCDIGAFEAEFLPVIQFSQMNYTNNEGIDTDQSIILVRSANLTMTAQVQVSLSGGTASSGTDYNNAGFPKTLTFGSGVVSQPVPISIIDDVLAESTETISLTVTNLSNAVIGAQNSAVLQIEDNNTATSPLPTIYLPLIIK